MMPKALGFLDLGGLDTAYRTLPGALRPDSPLHDVAASFIKNMDRVETTSELAFNLVAYSYHLWSALVRQGRPASVFVWSGGSLSEGFIDTSNLDHESKATFDRWQKQQQSRPSLRDIGFGQLTTVLELMQSTLGTTSVENTILGFQAIISSMVIDSWTAFEVLAGDLWETTLNSHPDSLAELDGKQDPAIVKRFIRKDKGSSPPKNTGEVGRGDSSKVIALSFLSANKFNMSDVMGSVLRARFQFSNLAELRDAYRQAFKKNEGDIVKYVYSDEIDLLAAVRNLVVHKASKVDAPFRNWVGSYEHFVGLKDGDTLTVDGALAITLINPVVQLAVKLVKSVDGWLERNGTNDEQQQQPG